MFYVKKEFDDLTITVEINDENVYGRCPFCGCEVQVDLQEVIQDDGDLFATAVACEKCSKKRGEVK